ncbi:MAG: hypothetical protein NT150_11900 [Bacteroidetes bacterium]|nr:hypothetical protein [Bacteroidota bacterium]
MELHLKIIGCLFVLLALVHGIFPKYFNWKKEFGAVSTANRQMMYVHTFFISLIVLLMGLLCLTSATELVETELGRKIAFGLFIFWGARMVIQFVGYSSELWRGKVFEIIVHIVFSLFWIYITVVFFLVFWG